jgi:tetratricopeptide (TPR) repeat protein
MALHSIATRAKVRATLTRGQKLFVVAAIVVGVVARLSGIIGDGSRVFQQFPTEDGYFMLSIARNLAIGKGFSVAGGAIPTNGTQPGTTLLWSILYVFAGGDRLLGVRLTLVLELVLSGVAGYLVYRLGRRVLAKRDGADGLAAVAGALWFMSQISVRHSMNTLETGFNALVAIAVAFVFIEPNGPERKVWSIPRCLAVGVLLGVAFWARNDSVFVILAACLTYVGAGFAHDLGAVVARFSRSIVFGLTSIVVASPWLAYNYTQFGHIMPVSGRAESLTGHFGSNLADLPPVLVEYLFGLLPIPQSLEVKLPVVVLCAVVVAIVVFYVAPRLWRQGTPMERSLIGFVAIYATGLSIFYGLAFGAGWFMSRYLFPLGGFFVIGFVAVGAHYLKRAPAIAMAVVGAALVLMNAGVNYRLYANGEKHPHFQVVRWAERHIPAPMWVGAIQTGTLNYFHDRTINLDGKVNIAAYEAIVDQRKGRYVAEGRIELLLDWWGMADWLQMPIVDQHFRLLVFDEPNNLGVLERKDALRPEQHLEPDRALRRLLQSRAEAALEREGLSPATRSDLLATLAQLERVTGDQAEAIRRAEAAAKASDDPARVGRAHVLRAHALRTTRDFAAAALAYEAALTAFDENTSTRRDQWEAWHGLADAKRMSKDPDAARAALAQAEALDASDRDRAVTALVIGDFYRDQNDGTQAQRFYESSLKLRRAFPEDQTGRARDLALAETRLARLLWNTDVERAKKLVTEGVSLRDAVAPGRGDWQAPAPDILRLAHTVFTSSTSTSGANP